MKATVTPSVLSGSIHAPASKSSMQRACAAAFIAKRKCIIKNPGNSNDDKAAIAIIRNLGADVQWQNDELLIDSTQLSNATSEINCDESGLSIRMFAPIAALQNHEITITGSGSLLSRPMNFFDEVLPKLGVSISSNNGKLPLKIKGPLQPKNIEIDGSLSSQFLTGLLMAYAALPNCNATITVTNLTSKPYIDLTIQVLKEFGFSIKNEGYQKFSFSTFHLQPSTFNYTIEGDWSGGAFLLVAGAIAGNMTVTGLDMNSTQADKKITEALISANAGMAIEAKAIKLHKTSMQAFTFDAVNCPDLFPPLVALAAYCTGTSVIRGIHRLTHKESNRAVTLQEEFAKMGVRIELINDDMLIHGDGNVKGSVVHSRHDHRIAMACAVAALGAKGETVIEQADAINKSYPDFYIHLQKLKAGVTLTL